jgi:WD40 repeat protein
MILKLFMLAVLLIISSRVAFSEYFKGHKFLSLLATIIAIITTFYLFQDIYKAERLPTNTKIDFTAYFQPKQDMFKTTAAFQAQQRKLLQQFNDEVKQRNLDYQAGVLHLTHYKANTQMFTMNLDWQADWVKQFFGELQNKGKAKIEVEEAKQIYNEGLEKTLFITANLNENQIEIQGVMIEKGQAYSIIPYIQPKSPVSHSEWKTIEAHSLRQVNPESPNFAVLKLAVPELKIESMSASTTETPSPVVDENTARKITKLLKTCQYRFDKDWLTYGGTGTALDCYKEILKLEPNNLDASRGLVNIENRYIKWAEKALKNEQKEKASRYLASLRKVNPKLPKLAMLESQLKLMGSTFPRNEWKAIKAHKGGGRGAICVDDCLAFSPDGRFILSGSYDKTLKLFNTNTKMLVRTFKGHSAHVWSVAFSPDGQRALSASRDTTIKLWNLSTGKVIRTFEGDSDYVLSVAYSSDGQRALSGGSENTIKLWNLSTGELIRTFKGHSDWVSSVAFSPNGQRALSGSRSGMKLWELSTGKLIHSFSGYSSSCSVTFSPDGQRALSGNYDKTMKLWDLSTGELIRSFEGHSDYVWSVAYSPDGRFIASGSGDKTVKLWDVSSGYLIRTFTGHKDSVRSVTFSPDGRLASGSRDGVIILWR